MNTSRQILNVFFRGYLIYFAIYFVNISSYRKILHHPSKASNIIHVNLVIIMYFTDCILAVFNRMSDENPLAVPVPAVSKKQGGFASHNAFPTDGS